MKISLNPEAWKSPEDHGSKPLKYC